MNLLNIVKHFSLEEEPVDIQAYGNGNINDTYQVVTSNRKFLIQRINSKVFPSPQSVMKNMTMVTRHMDEVVSREGLSHLSSWQVPEIIPSREGKSFYIDSDNECWRCLVFIEGTESFDVIGDSSKARSLGEALGIFHYLVSDIPFTSLSDTLPGFHITPNYLKHFNSVFESRGLDFASEKMDYCLNIIEEQKTYVSILEDARADGVLPLRIMHGDPKTNNVLFKKGTGDVVSMIDLDTVKPGLIHYDIGDCIRAACNTLGEEACENWREVNFDLDLCSSILEGYFSRAGSTLNREEFKFIYWSITLITFELGLRFLTDFLENNHYFSKIDFPEHNLHRALVQFRLLESIVKQRKQIEDVVGNLSSYYFDA